MPDNHIMDFTVWTNTHLSERALIALLLILLLTFYCFLSTKGSFEFREIQNLMNYDMLAEALLSGQLHLKLEMDPDRAKAPDPSDPELPFHGLTDAIAFKGKYYLLQQPLPAAFHAIWTVFTGRSLATGIGVIANASGCLILLGLILLKIRSTFLLRLPQLDIMVHMVVFRPVSCTNVHARPPDYLS